MAINTVVCKETPEMAKAISDFSEHYSQKLKEYFKQIAPFLDAINMKELKEAAEEMQTGLIVMKRWAAAPPYQNEKKPILNVLSIFKESEGTKKKKNEYLLGGELSKNFDYTKVESSRKRQRTEDEE